MASVAAPAQAGAGLARARDLLLGQVDATLARLRLQEALRVTILLLLIDLWILVPLVLCDRLFSLTQLGYSTWIIWAGLVCVGIPIVIARAFSRRISEQAAATLADDRLGLHSRLCTALTIHPDEPSGFGEAFHAEAAERLAGLDATQAVPVRCPRLAYLLPLPAVLAAGIWLLLPPQDRAGWLAETKRKERTEAAAKQAVQKLLDLKLLDVKRDVTEKAAEESAEYKVNRLIEQAKDIARQVEEGKLNGEQALQALASLKREIGEERGELRPEKDAAERLKQLKSEDLNLGENDLTRQVSEALKAGDADLAARQLRNLARKMREEILKNDAKSPEQKAADLEKLRREAERLAGALAEDQAAAEGLQELARKALGAEEYEKLSQELKKQAGKTPEEIAQELEKAINEAADDLEDLTEDNGEEDAADEKLDELDENVDEALDGL